MLSKFPNKTLKLGAIVSLSPDHEWVSYTRAEGLFSNPVGVRGVVVELNSYSPGSHNWLGVNWIDDSGNVIGSNNYPPNYYDLIAEGEPGFLATE